MNDPTKIVLRPATALDAATIAIVMRAALGSFLDAGHPHAG
ncbi:MULTISPECIES: hypothetical protein [unclassified Mesorhizobium]|nr:MULTISPECIES: hypothetical protein [unclassified Mesorhizobium]